jgi:hypothetical protein
MCLVGFCPLLSLPHWCDVERGSVAPTGVRVTIFIILVSNSVVHQQHLVIHHVPFPLCVISCHRHDGEGLDCTKIVVELITK